MGESSSKMNTRVITPVDVVIKQHPDRKRRILKCVKKWHKRTSGKNRWPTHGTFDLECCDEVERELRHVEMKDTKASYKLKNKRAKEKEVLGWFKQVGVRKQMIQIEREEKCADPQTDALDKTTPTAPPLPTTLPKMPPPYPGGEEKSGQYVLSGDKKGKTLQGQIEGKFTMTLNDETDIGDGHGAVTRGFSNSRVMSDLQSDSDSSNTEEDLDECQGELTVRPSGTTRKQQKEPNKSWTLDDCPEHRQRRKRAGRDNEQAQLELRKAQQLYEEERRELQLYAQEKKLVQEQLKEIQAMKIQLEQERQSMCAQENSKTSQESRNKLTTQQQSPVEGAEAPQQPRKQHITMTLEGVMETNKGIPNDDNKDILNVEDAYEDEEGLWSSTEVAENKGRTRSGRSYQQGSTLSLNDATLQCPIITRSSGRTQYAPWPFMDMISLANRLPALTEGADKWIVALEEITAGITLAVGDIKALLTYIAGKQITCEIFTNAGILVCDNRADGLQFGPYRTRVWTEVRKQYPAKRDPSKLEGEKLGETECPTKFLYSFQRKWKEETGIEWNKDHCTEALFRCMVQKALPEEVQKRLKTIVGLAKMEWALFTEHILHHVSQYREETKQQEEENKQLAKKLTQLQLGELVKQKKDKVKIQAPVITAGQPMSQPNGPAAAPQYDKMNIASNPNTVGPAPAVTYHNHYYGTSSCPEMNNNPRNFRGRGRGMPRGRMMNPGGWGRGAPVQAPQRPQQQPQPPNMVVQNQQPPMVNAPQIYNGPLRCWGCGEIGHNRRECPINPWESQVPGWSNQQQDALW